MAFDAKKFVEFMAQMDWEGGWPEMVDHGHDGAGDARLDGLLEELDGILDALNSRSSWLYQNYEDEIEAAAKEAGFEDF